MPRLSQRQLRNLHLTLLHSLRLQVESLIPYPTPRAARAGLPTPPAGQQLVAVLSLVFPMQGTLTAPITINRLEVLEVPVAVEL